MTLEEAIKHCEEVADQLEGKDGYAYTDSTCDECAKEHRQLAKWLRELRTLRGMLTCDGCMNEGELVNNGLPCSICKRNKNNRANFRDYYKNYQEEVNADDT